MLKRLNRSRPQYTRAVKSMFPDFLELGLAVMTSDDSLGVNVSGLGLRAQSVVLIQVPLSTAQTINMHNIHACVCVCVCVCARARVRVRVCVYVSTSGAWI